MKFFTAIFVAAMLSAAPSYAACISPNTPACVPLAWYKLKAAETLLDAKKTARAAQDPQKTSMERGFLDQAYFTQIQCVNVLGNWPSTCTTPSEKQRIAQNLNTGALGLNNTNTLTIPSAKDAERKTTTAILRVATF